MKWSRRSVLKSTGGFAVLPLIDVEGWLSGLFSSGDDSEGSIGRAESPVGVFQLAPPLIYEFKNDLSNAEIAAFRLADNEAFELTNLQVRLEGGGTDPGLTADVYDASADEVLAGTSDSMRGSPLATSSKGARIVVRVTNRTENYQHAAVTASGNVVE